MLRCQDLSLQAGRFCLHPITLRVPEASFQVILGPTGSGKTLLLEMLAGLRKPGGGRIWHDARELTALPPEQRELAYLPQDGALFPHLSVADNIYFGLRFRRRPGAQHQQRIEELIDWLGVRHLLDRKPQGLSGGEQQRVALLRALASGTHTLLLDEPTAALHQTMRDEVSLMLRDLQRKLALTVVMVTHDLSSAFFLADQLSVLIEGRLQQTGPPLDIFYRPATRAVADFLGLRNLFRAYWRTREELICPDLGGDWPLLPPAGSAAERGWLGLHPEGLTLLAAHQPVPAGYWLAGEITRHLQKGDHVEAWVQLQGSGQYLRLRLAPQAWEAESFAVGQAVRVHVATKGVFWISDPE